MNTHFYFSIRNWSKLCLLHSLVLRALYLTSSERALLLLATMFFSWAGCDCIWGRSFLWKRSRTTCSSWECRLWTLLRCFCYPLCFSLHLERVFMAPICCANCLVSLFPLGVKTSSLNKWWLVRGCRGRCMLLDPSCGFAVIAEFKHRFRELKTWVHFSLKGLEICIFRDADISEKTKYSVPECFPRWRWLMKSLSPRNFSPDEALNVPFGWSWLVAGELMDSYDHVITWVGSDF